MLNIPNKVNGDYVADTEWNSPIDELENAVTTSGQSLSGSDNEQLAKAIATYAGVGDYYNDSGSANAYVLSSVGTQKAPYSYITGIKIRFAPANTSTGASTVNVAGLGIKSIVTYNNKALIGGELTAYRLITVYYDGTNFRLEQNGLLQQKAFVEGLIFSNNGSTPNTHLDVSTGYCTDTNKNVILESTNAFIKRIDQVWVAGSGNGGRASAVSLSPNTWYHFFIIGKSDGTIDFGFDTSISATNLLAGAAGYIYYKHIGDILTNSSSYIITIYMFENSNGRCVLWKTPINDVTYSIVAAYENITVTMSVPPNIITNGLFRIHADAGGIVAGDLLAAVQSLSVNTISNADLLINQQIDGIYTGTTYHSGHSEVVVTTNASSQIQLTYRTNASSPYTGVVCRVFTLGWTY